MKAIVNAQGVLINIGEWDFDITHDADGVEVINNPMPNGAQEVDIDITFCSNGKAFRSDDYYNLRKSEYPPIGDQLDILFKAGLFPPEMAEKIQAIKDKYPKTVNSSESEADG
ncbi:hypothetical protein U8291_12795 [Pseudomonas sp. A2]|uniref:hypothetical protein n=1 Tax=Pseudomonas sp. A2 TaxID=107445 RepID=UPI002C665011|nr:hypothetical protein [Pseudomonas sp. A2]MEB3437902.1 hypothetical protein [Pseudomonas sp. A2]